MTDPGGGRTGAHDTDTTAARRRPAQARVRPALMAVVGIGVTLVVWALGHPLLAPAAGWCTAAVLYDVWVWGVIVRMDVGQTRSHALAEDPTRRGREALVLAANTGALGAVVAVIVASGDAQGTARGLIAALGLVTVAASWLLVHTVFTLRYAAQYFAAPEGGIGFNQSEAPRYTDIAYMAFSLGMTYQVSDNAIETTEIRTTALVHSLLAFVFGTGIMATTINLVVSLVS